MRGDVIGLAIRARGWQMTRADWPLCAPSAASLSDESLRRLTVDLAKAFFSPAENLRRMTAGREDN